MKIAYLHPRGRDLVGWIPMFLKEDDPRPAREQFNQRYAHGGGWNPFPGFTYDAAKLTITYPGDPPYRAVAKIELREEMILVFPHAWVAIVQPDGAIEVSRMD